TLLLLAVPLLAGAATPPRRVFIAADSTAAGYGPERAPRNGWGQHLQGFLDPGAFEVRHHAIGGGSPPSFLAAGPPEALARVRRRHVSPGWPGGSGASARCWPPTPATPRPRASWPGASRGRWSTSTPAAATGAARSARKPRAPITSTCRNAASPTTPTFRRAA